MNLKLVNPPFTYSLPDKHVIQETTQRICLQTYSQILLNNIAIKFAGGTVVDKIDADKIKNIVKDKLQLVYDHRIGSVVFGRNVFRQELDVEGGKFIPINMIDNITAQTIRYYENMRYFINLLVPDNIPGDTPLEKAAACLKLFNAHPELRKIGFDPLGELASNLFNSYHTFIEQVATDINDLCFNYSKLDTIDHMLLDCMKNYIFDKTTTSDDVWMQQVNKLEEFMYNDKFSIFLQIHRILDNCSFIQKSKTKEFIEDPCGSILTNTVATLADLPYTDRCIEYYGDNDSRKKLLLEILNGDVDAQKLHREIEKKQLLLVLCDHSGSMSGIRSSYSNAIVMYLLKQVILGNAEVFLRLFTTEIEPPLQTPHAYDAYTAKEMLKEFSKKSIADGGTEIGNSVNSAIVEVRNLCKKNKSYIKPAIVIITDGDDSSSFIMKDLHNIKLHGFSILDENPMLERIVKSCGGIYRSLL